MKKYLIPLVIIAILALLLVAYLKFSTEKERVTVSHQSIVERIEAMGTLNLVKVKIKDVLEYEVKKETIASELTHIGALAGKAELLLIISGEAECGIDLTQVKPADIETRGNKLIVKLPQPVITGYKVNHQESHIYKEAEINWWGRLSGLKKEQLIDAAYKEAEKKIQADAQAMGVTETARQNAIKLLTPLLTQASGRPVEVVFSGP